MIDFLHSLLSSASLSPYESVSGCLLCDVLWCSWSAQESSSCELFAHCEELQHIEAQLDSLTNVLLSRERPSFSLLLQLSSAVQRLSVVLRLEPQELVPAFIVVSWFDFALLALDAAATPLQTARSQGLVVPRSSVIDAFNALRGGGDVERVRELLRDLQPLPLLGAQRCPAWRAQAQHLRQTLAAPLIAQDALSDVKHQRDIDRLQLKATQNTLLIECQRRQQLQQHLSNLQKRVAEVDRVREQLERLQSQQHQVVWTALVLASMFVSPKGVATDKACRYDGA